jgi:hypothetical protein
MARHYSKGRAAKRGKQDGTDYRWVFWPFKRDNKEADPPIDSQEPSQYQEELIARLNQRVSEIEYKKWSAVNEKLKEACQNCRSTYMDIKGRLKSADVQACEELRKAKEALVKFPMPSLSMTLYWIIFLFITACDMLFNSQVFNIFGESALQNAIMALGLIIAIPVLAQDAGRQVALGKHNKKNIFLMILEIVVVLAGLIAITIMYKKYLVGIKALESFGISISPEQLAFIFLLINLVLFTGLFVVAYESGHKDPLGYKMALKEVRAAEIELQKNAGINADLVKKFVEASYQWTKTHTDRRNVFESTQKKIQKEIAAWLGYIEIFQTENMRMRKNKTKPESFKVVHHVADFFPVAMQTLDCNGCQYEDEIK